MKNTLYDADFLKQFTLSILKVIERKEFNIPETKIIIDADLIPELSEEVMKEYMMNQELMKKLQEIEEMDFLQAEPIQLKPLSNSQHKVLQNIGLSPKIISQGKPIIEIPAVIEESDGYEKIKPLLNDYTVSRIQCIAPLKPLMIIHSGQKQITKIVLSQNEIHGVFQYFTEIAHLPLIEGPLKIITNNMEINGINSKLMDSKFIIQKNTAYSLLEEQRQNRQPHMMMRR